MGDGLNDMIKETIEYGENAIVGDGDDDIGFKQEFTMTIEEINSSVGKSDNDIVLDYKKARNLLYSLTATCQKALEGAMSLSLDVVHPRSFEVVNQLIVTMKDLSKDLVNLQTQYQKALLEIKDNEDGDEPDEDDEDNTTNIDGSMQEILNSMERIEKTVNKKMGIEDGQSKTK